MALSRPNPAQRPTESRSRLEIPCHRARLAGLAFRELRVGDKPRSDQAALPAERPPRKVTEDPRADRPERDLEPFVAPPAVLLTRPEPSAAPLAPSSSGVRVAETQALVERLVTSMRVGKSARGAEVHMTLGAHGSAVRVREANGELEVTVRGAGEASAMATRIESALDARGLRATVRFEAE